MAENAVYCYTWSEDESAKGSNEVASALRNTLRSASYEEIEEVRFVAEGCAGQHIRICMIFRWLQDEVSEAVLKITLVFPVTGLPPPDRVFGGIEKDIRRHY
ncbi:hypothetical protein HPB49_007063 [Dermacentor silvarum]|uniref:Uncharacterized protein n=1 Tax=Dermacentor silvarum TaxID=543639 RepID=A0ACB8D3P3_DERSI|nr:hypothetical protein HPB49_007063 [Dermacentor silvarum]